MISVREAKQIILSRSYPAPPVTLAIAESAGLVLAKPIFAAVDVPAFPQSAMDGYAFRFSDWEQEPQLHIAGEVAAGDNARTPLMPGQAVRIFTGAPLPPGADTVIEQESTEIRQTVLHIDHPGFSAGKNVRPSGAEIRAGALALPEGSLLTPAAIGFLMGVGAAEVQVYAPPRVTLIVTGNELQDPGQPLQYGQVYESNSGALRAALQQAGIRSVTVMRAADRLELLTDTLSKALDNSDWVLLTGGISVGDYDFAREATRRCGVEEGFYKVKQRPGKPLFFGAKAQQLVFALPGNPASALSCFYEYVLPAIGVALHRPLALPVVWAPLAEAVGKSTDLTHFLKGFYNGTTVQPLTAQESFRLSSFALANCLIVLEEDMKHCAAGQPVEIHLLPA